MKKVKITVLKTTLDEELAKEYGAEGLTASPMMKEGHNNVDMSEMRANI